MFPVGFGLVVELTRIEATSALPDAPVAPDPPRHVNRVRTSCAALLRGLATGATRAATVVDPYPEEPADRSVTAAGPMGGTTHRG